MSFRTGPRVNLLDAIQTARGRLASAFSTKAQTFDSHEQDEHAQFAAPPVNGYTSAGPYGTRNARPKFTPWNEDYGPSSSK